MRTRDAVVSGFVTNQNFKADSTVNVFCASLIQAPEMIKGEVVGPPADIWTVGVVTHIM